MLLIKYTVYERFRVDAEGFDAANSSELVEIMLSLVSCTLINCIHLWSTAGLYALLRKTM